MRKDFAAFMAEYNVIGMAIWLLIWVKVWEFVKSIVEDLVTPLFFAPVFKKLKIEKLEDLSWHGVLYGKALARFIDFLLTAFVVFLVIHYLWVEKA